MLIPRQHFGYYRIRLSDATLWRWALRGAHGAPKCALQSARRAIPKATKAADEKEQRRALLSEIRALGKEPDAAGTTEMDE